MKMCKVWVLSMHIYVCPHYSTPRLNLFNEKGHIKENVSRDDFVVKVFKILNESEQVF